MPSVSPQVIQVRPIVHRTSSPPAQPPGRGRSARVKSRTPLVVALAAGTAAAAAMVAIAQPATAQPTSPAAAAAKASDSAKSLVAAKPSYLHASADDAFVQRPVIQSAGMNYVPFERQYK